jgi:hypothetical protein
MEEECVTQLSKYTLLVFGLFKTLLQIHRVHKTKRKGCVSIELGGTWEQAVFAVYRLRVYISSCLEMLIMPRKAQLLTTAYRPDSHLTTTAEERKSREHVIAAGMITYRGDKHRATHENT